MRVSSVTVALIVLTTQTSAFLSPLFAKTAVKPKAKKAAEKKPAFNFPSFANKKDASVNGKKAPIKKQPSAKKSVTVKGGKAKVTPASKKNTAIKAEFPKLGDTKAPKLPNISLPSLPLPSISFSSIPLTSPVGIAGIAMDTISPLMAYEAKIQAGVLVTVVDIIGDPFRVSPDEIRAETKKRISSAKPVLYTYGLSPFSGEAKKILEGYDVEVVEVGPEWFLLGPGGSEKRLALAENSPKLQTSLPHLFLKGESLGGLSTGGRNNAGIIGLQQSGELDKLFKKAVVKKAVAKKVAVTKKKPAVAKKKVVKKIVSKKK